MSQGFNDKFEITVYKEELEKILKKYKKVKKYMKSNLYAVQTMDGTETYVKNLIEDIKEDPVE